MNFNILKNTPYRTDLLLVVCSFSIYFFYFHHIFFNINSLLSSITLDSLKNYYTFVFHIKNDVNALSFSGLNYPYGEHIVYTDCQPILTFILRVLPFTHPYLIGILHGFMFASFIISPVILNKIFRILEVDEYVSFFSSLGIALLAPQFLKINAGHFALAYGCIFPLAILFLLRYILSRSKKHFFILFVFNTLLFFLHPYLGLCVIIFCFISLMLYDFVPFKKSTFFCAILSNLSLSIVPLVLFKVFMLFTDQHSDRTTEPFGAELMVENIDSILAPVFGPFQSFMEYFFPNRTSHYEGHTYLGFFTILLGLLSVLLLPFFYKKIKFRKDILVIFIGSFILLLISFGIHLKLFDYLNIKSSTLNQFRAVCRFSWLFYYTLPLLLISLLFHSLKKYISLKRFSLLMATGSILFFSFNLLEANYFFKLNEDAYWKFRNFFNTDYLNKEELNNLMEIRQKKPQAIIPLPIYHGGSEMYDRLGSSNSMVPSMIYSFHANLPILSVMLSRTSLTETENLIQVLNSYKRKKPITALFNDKAFFVINTNDPKLPDEERLLKKVSLKGENDSLNFAFISKTELLSRATTNEALNLNLIKKTDQEHQNVVFIESENRKPFLESNIQNYETIYVLDSNTLRSGKYVVSLHYYYSKRTYQALACGLIVTRSKGSDSEWQYVLPIRYLSGFYAGYGVFEYTIDLEKENKYEFILKGDLNENYHISCFLLRPVELDTRFVSTTQDTLYNNFSN